MTYPKGHPPAAKLGPVIFLPPAYDGFGAYYDEPNPAAECPTCDHSPTGLCPGCCWACTDTWCPEHLAEGREDGAVDEARARWEES